MARITGPALDRLDDESDSYADLVARTIRTVMRRVASDIGEHSSEQDLAPIRHRWAQFVDSLLLPELGRVWEGAASDVYDQLARAAERVDRERNGAQTAALVAAPFSIPRVVNWLAQKILGLARNRLVAVGDDVWETARAQLLEGMQAGEGINDIRDRLTRATPELTEKRAAVIARTEVQGASNDGALEQVRALGLDATKEWIATLSDNRTRSSHLAADGQTVRLNEKFTVGGYPLDRPHDPAAPPVETVNCRCTLGYEISDDLLAGEEPDMTVTAAGDPARGDVSDKGMIALIPSQADLDRLSGASTEPLHGAGIEIREELHLTLAFLGDITEWTPEQKQAVMSVMEGLASVGIPVKGRGFYIAHFNPDGDDPCWVLGVGGEELSIFHMYTWDGLRTTETLLPELPDQHSPWIPHVTLAYTDNVSMGASLMDRVGDITFDAIRVAFGDDVTDIPLTDSARTASSTVSPAALHQPAMSPVTRGGPVTQTLPEVDTDVTPANGSGDCAGCHDAEHFGSTSAPISDSKTWDGSSSRFSDEEYQRSAAGCDPGSEPPKTRCFLPHHEPGGAVNRAGVHAAAGRANQLKGHSPEAVARAKSHLRGHYRQLGEDVPDNLKADADDVVTAAAEDCPPGHHRMPDSDECMPDEDMGGSQIQSLRAGTDETLPAAEMVGDPEVPAAWEGVLVVEGVATGDGREFAADSLTWAELPIPLRWKKEDSHGGDNDVTVSVGSIDQVWRDGNQVRGRGVFDMGSEDGREAYRRVGEGFLRGVSIDADDITDADVEYIWPEDNEASAQDDEGELIKMLFAAPEKMIFNKGRIRAATLVDIPAFVEAYVQLVDKESGNVVTAAGHTITIPDLPPASWFNEPTGVTQYGALTVTDEGRVYGLLAPAKIAHRSFRDRRIEVPMGNVDYSRWMGSEALVAGGRVVAGPITMNCGHISPYTSSDSTVRMEHYDNSCSVVANACIGENGNGVWIAGALLPGVTADQVTRMMSCRLSGDWAPHPERPGWQEFVAALLVPVPGFPMARSAPSVRVASGQLVASAVPVRFASGQRLPTGLTETELDRRALRLMADRLARRVHREESA